MPYFIKVITTAPDYTYQKPNHGAKLALPAPFIREHFLKLEKDCTLEDALDGRTWKVSSGIGAGARFWSKGWPEFAQQNDLRRATIIVFALVGHSRFIFTLFNDQGCRIIHPSRAKQVVTFSSEEKRVVNRSSFHSPSCPKHYTKRMRQKLEFQEDGASISPDMKYADDFPAQKFGLNNVMISNYQQPKRKLKASVSSAAQDNHHICIHMGFSCGQHRRGQENPKIQPLNQTLSMSRYSDLLDESQKGLEHVHIVDQCMDTNQPLVEEMTMSVANGESGNIFEGSDEQFNKAAHLDPTWFTFMSKRRIVTNAEKREAKHAASRYSRALRRANSITVMKEFHVYKEFIMELPKTLLLLGDTVEFPQPALTLVDSTGRSWEMQWSASGRHRLALVPKDWALFTVHHFLEGGDVCVFEATDIKALTILVRIFRVVDIPDNISTNGIYTHYSVESTF